MAAGAEALQQPRVAMGNPGADFRDGQWDAIDHIVSRGRRTSGKSRQYRADTDDAACCPLGLTCSIQTSPSEPTRLRPIQVDLARIPRRPRSPPRALAVAVFGADTECGRTPKAAVRTAADQTPIRRPKRGGVSVGTGPRDTIALSGQLFYDACPDIEVALGNFRPQLPRTDDYVHSPEYLALLRIAMGCMRAHTIELLVTGLPVIDAGSRTFDWLETRGMRLVTSRSNSVNRSVHNVLTMIADEISHDIGDPFRDLEALDHAPREVRPLALWGKPYAVEKYRPSRDAAAWPAVGVDRQRRDARSRRDALCARRWRRCRSDEVIGAAIRRDPAQYLSVRN